jgi:competence protein ComEC
VFLPDGKLLNAEIIAQGYGHAYTRFPFARMEELLALERQARDGNRGLWGRSGEPTVAAAGAVAPASTPSAADGSETVYVTRTGTKYHRAGCRYLSKSAIPTTLKDAAARYGPCSVCLPPRLQAADAAPAKPVGPGDGTTPTPKAVAPGADDTSQTVYVTKTGTKYHRAGCRYLAKSQIPLPLKEAAARYSPCGVCAPPSPSASGAPATEPAPKATAPAPAPSAGGRCQAITKAGTQCKRNAAAGSRYCWQHQR